MSARKVTTFDAETGEVKERPWFGTYHECSHVTDCYEEDFETDPLTIALGIMHEDLLPFLERAKGGEIRVTFSLERPGAASTKGERKPGGPVQAGRPWTP